MWNINILFIFEKKKLFLDYIWLNMKIIKGWKREQEKEKNIIINNLQQQKAAYFISYLK